MDHELTQAEREQMREFLGSKAAGIILDTADKVKSPPSGEKSGRQDPKVDGKGRYYTEVEDPRDGKVKRLDPQTLERLALDPQVGAALEIIKLPILTIRPEVQHPEEEIREFLQYELDRSWISLARDLLSALEFGYMVAEKIYERRDTTIERDGRVLLEKEMVVYKRIKAMHPSAVELLIGEHGEDEGFKQITGGKAEVGPEKTLRYTHAMRFGNPYGNPRTRRAYKPWWWSELIYQFANRYFEDQSIPQRKVYYEPDPEPTDPDDPDSIVTDRALTDALKIAEDSRSGAAVAFPLNSSTDDKGVTHLTKGWDMEYLLGPNKQAEFTAYLDHLDLKKMRGMFVPEKLTNQSGPGATGSYAMVESLSDLFLLGEESLAADILDTLAHAWARPLINYNFGSSAPDARFAPVALSQDNRAFLQDFFKQLMVSLLANPYGSSAAHAPQIDLEGFAEQLGVPLRKNEDDGVTDQEVDEDAPDTARVPATQQHAHGPGCRHDHEHHTFAEPPNKRKARYGREWETATQDFQEQLATRYDEWANETANAIQAAPAASRQELLDLHLGELERMLKRDYRAAMATAQELGYGEAPTPEALEGFARRLKAVEARVSNEVVPKLRQRISADLDDETVNLRDAIQIRMGIVTNDGAGSYWDTIQQGWADQRREREADPNAEVSQIRWVLDPLVKEHCDDCPRFAGVYDSVDDLPAIPGDGSTECSIYCRCWLEERDPDTGNWVRRITDL